jgi:dihydrofolate synthase/folylpolyglutamate synthase
VTMKTAGLANVPGVSTDSGSKYREMLAWLYQTQLFGIKLGLDSIRRMLDELEVPAKGQRILHVAGTNGKGSVCAMMAAICRAQGYRTGLFISPHLITYRERIQVNGLLITQDEVATSLERIRRMIQDWDPHPTFFEITTALALAHFKERHCEVIVLETGLGGRLDATNAVTPVVSVITPIGYDHQKWLGNTLEEIAGEKAGIIKPGVPVVSAAQEPAAENVLRVRASECDSSTTFTRDPYTKSPVALSGAHQKRNAALAIEALRLGGIHTDESAIERGLKSVEWPARFQRWDERIVIDGAHNPAGAESLAQTWRESYGGRRATIILAVLADKDARGICAALASIAERILLTPIRGERALSPDGLAQVLSSITPSLPYSIAPSLEEALRLARAESDPILITGSLHFAGEAIAFLRGDMGAFEECAQ